MFSTCLISDRDETRLVEERDVSNVKIRKTVIQLIICTSWQKVGCGKEIEKLIPRRNITN